MGGRHRMIDKMTDEANRWLRERTTTGDAYDATYDRRAAYDATYDRRAAGGEDVHGEATFVMRFDPASVLDAGCGTGRVGRELARRGVEVVGVDIDAEMLDTARRKAPAVDWRLADLSTADLGRPFDAIVMAGNVMIFLEPGTEGAVVTNMARCVAAAGVLIAGFQLQSGRLTLGRYDEMAAAAGEIARTGETARAIAGRIQDRLLGSGAVYSGVLLRIKEGDFGL